MVFNRASVVSRASVEVGGRSREKGERKREGRPPPALKTYPCESCDRVDQLPKGAVSEIRSTITWMP